MYRLDEIKKDIANRSVKFPIFLKHFSMAPMYSLNALFKRRMK